MSQKKRGTAERLVLGVSGQVLSRVVSALNSILLVPVLIHAWGLVGYGQWMALTALASFLSYSNFGLVATSAYEMVMAAGAGDDARARRAFQMSANLAVYIVVPVLAVALLIAATVPIERYLKLSEIGASAAFAILVLSGAQLWVQTVRSLFVAVLNAVGSYGFAYSVNAGFKFAELLVVAGVVLLFHATPLGVAAVLVASPLLELVVVSTAARRAAAWARFDLRNFDVAWLKTHIRPAIGFLVSNLSTQSVLVQGPRIVLAAVLGGRAVAIYSVYSTAMRLVDQLLMIVSGPLEVEVARSVGRTEADKTFRLVVLGTQFAWIAFAGVAVALMVLGPWIFAIWTRGRVEFSYSLMALVIALSGFTQIGRVSVLALISANRMYGPSFVMLAVAGAGLGLGALLAPAFGVGGVVMGSALGELASSLYAVALLARWLERPVAAFFRETLDFNSSARELGDRVRGLVASRLR